MADKSYLLKISDVVKVGNCGGKWDVVFEQHPCIDITCNLSDGTIKITVPEGCEHTCLYGVATPIDPCDTFGEVPVKVCPCEFDTDCKSCETCGPLGVCISNCPGSDICTDYGTCGDCDELHPCSGGKQCVSGHCECPPTKPYLLENGNCSECISDGHCPPCHVCTPNGCIPVVCEIGVCDPDTNGCVECNSKNDCNGVNECCGAGHKCDCCEGYVRDQNGICVPKPECTSDEECSDCEFCNILTGKCNPTECPAGQICYGNGCVDICDCSNPTCGDNRACVPLGNGICGCLTCTGDCESGCSQNCYCDKGVNACLPNTCGGDCTSGAECGPNCGCNPDTKKCEPCTSQNCTGCNNLLGCKCTDGVHCVDVDDCQSITCASGDDCGPNCGCDDGLCKSCANYDCQECAQINGCKCTDGVTCEKDTTCDDKISFEKIDSSCDLVVNQEIKDGCSCSPITIVGISEGGTENANNFNVSFKVELRKGLGTATNYNSLSLLGDITKDNIAYNEEPVSGSVIVRTITYHDIYELKYNPDSHGVPIETLLQQNSEIWKTEDKIGSLANKDHVSIAGNTLYKIGYVTNYVAPTPTTSGIRSKVSFVKIVLLKQSQFHFENNCNYNDVVSVGQFLFYTNEDLKNIANPVSTKFPLIGIMKSEDKRLPMITFRKSTTYGGSIFETFRKVYSLANGVGKYLDKIYGPKAFDLENAQPLAEPEGLLWSGRNYIASSDCGCTNAIDIGKVVFCNPSDFNYEVVPNTCNKKIELKGPFLPCHVNQDLRQYGFANTVDFQVKYVLFINGEEIATFRHDKDLGMVDANNPSKKMFDIFEAKDKKPITEIRLKINHDTIGECDIVKTIAPFNVTPADIVADFKCLDGLDKYEATFDKVVNGYTITSIESKNSIINVISNTSTSITIGNLQRNVNTNLIIKFSSGCEIEYDIIDNCCSLGRVTIVGSSGCGSATGSLTVDTVGLGSSPSFEWRKGGVVIGTTKEITASDLGQYGVKVIDGSCEYLDNFELKSSTVVNFTLSASAHCQNVPLVLTVTGDDGANIQIQGPTGVINQNSGTWAGGVWTHTIQSPHAPTLVDDVYELVSYSIGTCSYNPEIKRIYTKSSISYANFGPTPLFCTGISTDISIVGVIAPDEILTLESASDVKFDGQSGPYQIPAGHTTVALNFASPGSNQKVILRSNKSSCNAVSPEMIVNVRATPILSSSNVDRECEFDQVNSEVRIVISSLASGVTLGVDVPGVTFSYVGGLYRSTYFAIPTSGVVTITASNGGCETSYDFSISPCNCVELNVILDKSGTYNICDSGTGSISLDFVNSTAIPVGSTYVWKKNGNVIIGATTDTISITNILDEGTYVLEVHHGGCISQSDAVFVQYLEVPNVTMSVDYNTACNNVSCEGERFFSLNFNSFINIVSVEWYLNTVLQTGLNSGNDTSWSGNFTNASSGNVVKAKVFYGDQNNPCFVEVESFPFNVVVCQEVTSYKIKLENDTTPTTNGYMNEVDFSGGGGLLGGNVILKYKKTIEKTVNGVPSVLSVVSETKTIASNVSIDVYGVPSDANRITSVRYVIGGVMSTYTVPVGQRENTHVERGALAAALNALIGVTNISFVSNPSLTIRYLHQPIVPGMTDGLYYINMAAVGAVANTGAVETMTFTRVNNSGTSSYPGDYIRFDESYTSDCGVVRFKMDQYCLYGGNVSNGYIPLSFDFNNSFLNGDPHSLNYLPGHAPNSSNCVECI